MASGSTMRAAAEVLRTLGLARIAVAIPLAPPSCCTEFRDIAEE